jgi:hypothetical protein
MFLEFRKRKTELTENGNFRLFAENGNGKLPFVCLKRKRKLVFLGRQMINGNRRVLFQQTCPSMYLSTVGPGYAAYQSS